MTRFFCDLDHTLVFSHRVSIPSPKEVVETLNGKDQSFMTKKALSFFRSQTHLEFIPLTTRTRQQYDRISFLRESPRYALICNGGILLLNGQEDPLWYQESMDRIAPESRALEEALAAAKSISPDRPIHNVRGLFFYFGSSDPGEAAAALRRCLPGVPLQILHDRHKVYCLPGPLTKGAAIGRFRDRFGPARDIAAGDSLFDVSMLNAVDTALYPPELAPFVHARQCLCISDLPFSDGICDYLKGVSHD